MRKAEVITTVSYSLKGKISNIRKDRVFVIQNGVDRSMFRPLDRAKCRKELDLPQNAKLVGYAGSIHRLEGVDRLVEMFELLKKEVKNCHLVIAGRYPKNEERYINLDREGIIYLESLTQENVVKLINACDVAIVPYTNNYQVTYGFPYKLVEYMACKAAIVATEVGDVRLIMKNRKDSLCSADSIEDMKNKVIAKLKNPKKYSYEKELKELTWEALARKFDKIIRK